MTPPGTLLAIRPPCGLACLVGKDDAEETEIRCCSHGAVRRRVARPATVEGFKRSSALFTNSDSGPRRLSGRLSVSPITIHARLP